MDFELSQDQRLIQDSVREIASSYDENYWTDIRMSERFPSELYRDLADNGFLGVLFPEKYGGQDLGLIETILIMEVLGEEGAWEVSGALILSLIFGGVGVLEHGSEEQKEQYLSPIIEGESLWAIAMTEPDAGLNTANTKTYARYERDEFVINGHKQWISGIGKADNVLLLARTTPREEVNEPFDGLTMFIIDPTDDAVSYEEIPMDIYYRDSTYDVYIDDLRVSETNVLGDVGNGMRQIFDTLNTERITAAAEAWGMGRWVLDQAVQQAKDRTVWDEPIGAHQAIQHPLAAAHAELVAARTLIREAAWRYDTNHGDVGEISNIVNLLAGKAAWNAAEASMTTFGGMSVSSELGIAAAWETIRHYRTAPVSEEMICNYIGHHSLGLPKSY